MNHSKETPIIEHFRNEQYYFANQLIHDEEDLLDVEDEGYESDETYNPHPYLEHWRIDAAKILEED